MKLAIIFSLAAALTLQTTFSADEFATNSLSDTKIIVALPRLCGQRVSACGMGIFSSGWFQSPQVI